MNAGEAGRPAARAQRSRAGAAALRLRRGGPLLFLLNQIAGEVLPAGSLLALLGLRPHTDPKGPAARAQRSRAGRSERSRRGAPPARRSRGGPPKAERSSGDGLAGVLFLLDAKPCVRRSRCLYSSMEFLQTSCFPLLGGTAKFTWALDPHPEKVFEGGLALLSSGLGHRQIPELRALALDSISETLLGFTLFYSRGAQRLMVKQS